MAAGTPESRAKVAASHTGRYLRPILSGRVGVSPADRRVSRRYAFELDDDVLALRAAEVPPGKMPAAAGKMPTLPERNNALRIHGAREHNLKNISLDIPRDKMVIITGLSGSGKSTVAFDILFAEGQRRFLDSMSP